MRIAALVLAVVCLTPAIGRAETLHGAPERIAEPVERAAHAPHKPAFIVMPIPVSDPAIGSGIALAALAIYHQDESGKPWTTGVGALYTDSPSWAAAAFHKGQFAGDRFRLKLMAGYGDFNLDFYGIGPQAGDRGVSIGLEQEAIGGLIDGLIRVPPNLYLGLRYRGAIVNSSVDTSTLPFPDLDLSDIELDSVTSGIGLIAEYDTRDNEFNPGSGALADAQFLYAAEAIGSDFEYARASAATNFYHAFGKTVLAMRGSLCWSDDGAPFYDLCNFGSQSDLRGYSNGQYRDHAMFAVQAEARRHLFWRIGAVAFAGIGGVAPEFDEFGSQKLLPAAGAGLRFLASRSNKMNLSIDYAFGRDASALYFRVGEAF